MEDHDVRIVRGAIGATALAAPIAILLGWLAQGSRGAIGAGLGITLAAVFFSLTVLAVGYAGKVAPELMMPAALGTYAAKLVLLGVALFALRDTSAFDKSAFAVATVAGTVVYLVAEMRIALRSKVPYVDTGEG